MTLLLSPVAATLALGAAALALACSESPPPDTHDAPAPVPAEPARSGPSPATAQALGIPNAHHPFPNLLTAGALTPAHLGALAEAGYGTFVTLRSSEEDGSGWEEAYAAERGLTFHRVAVAGAAGLTRENAEMLDRILVAAGDTPTVLWCGSANRVGALLAVRAHWLQGASPEDALALGRSAGLLGLEPAVVNLLGIDPSTP